MKVESKTLDWLLEPSQPAIQYYTLTSLLDRKENDPEVRDAKEKILKKGWAADILTAQKPDGYWEAAHSPEGYSLYRPKYTATNWRMIVLSDFPLSFRDDVRLERGCNLFFRNWLGNEDEFEAQGEVCISGNLARMLTKFGYGDDPRVKRVVDWLVKVQKEDGGWHCFPSKTGTLDCWEALAAFAAIPKENRTKPINRSIERGGEFYLARKLHEEGQRYEPWYRFHYPNHYYYDVLDGLDVLTSLGFTKDPRLEYALNLLKEKRLSSGEWILDATHPDVGPGADYAVEGTPIKFALEEKGRPSKWITLTALKVLKRVEED